MHGATTAGGATVVAGYSSVHCIQYLAEGAKLYEYWQQYKQDHLCSNVKPNPFGGCGDICSYAGILWTTALMRWGGRIISGLVKSVTSVF